MTAYSLQIIFFVAIGYVMYGTIQCYCISNTIFHYISGFCKLFLKEQFLEFGGTLKDGETVAEVWPGETVTIKTNNNLFTAKKVIITAGKQSIS